MSIIRNRNKTTVRFGSSKVITTDPTFAQAEEVARSLFPEMSKILDGAMSPIYKTTLAHWPTPGEKNPQSTGRSYHAFQYRRAYLSKNGVLKTSISNSARNPRDGFQYPYVVRTRATKGKKVWAVYVSKPFGKTTKKMINEMIAEYRNILRRANG
jgi:hypothetical protein